MLLEEAAAEILRPGGALACALPGFEPRAGQLAMAKRVARAIDLDERLLVEAGTGTGKTIAYLVPAILSGRRVVVSTGTRTLQDQIAAVDLPRLQRVLPRPFSFAVMKGIGNYVCLRRFHDHRHQLAIASTVAPGTARVLAWAERSPTGDRAELDGVPEEAAIWRDITSSPETRLGKRCPFVADCFITAMRRRAAEAQVLVVNHHLFFADLALRSRYPEAQVLPSYEAVIFDEAHQLEDIATEIFGVQASTLRLFALGRDVERAPAGPLNAGRVESVARRIEAGTHLLGQVLRGRLPRKSGEADDLRMPMPDDLWQGEVLTRYHDLDTVLEEASVLLARLAEDDGSELAGPSPPAPAKAAVLAGLAQRALMPLIFCELAVSAGAGARPPAGAAGGESAHRSRRDREQRAPRFRALAGALRAQRDPAGLAGGRGAAPTRELRPARGAARLHLGHAVDRGVLRLHA